MTTSLKGRAVASPRYEGTGPKWTAISRSIIIRVLVVGIEALSTCKPQIRRPISQ